jgi:hypothetical protein
MPDLVIVSMHENGFPIADLYRDCGDMPADEFERLGMAPDGFFTMKKGDSLNQAIAKAKDKWPEAVVCLAGDDGDDN